MSLLCFVILFVLCSSFNFLTSVFLFSYYLQTADETFGIFVLFVLSLKSESDVKFYRIMKMERERERKEEEKKLGGGVEGGSGGGGTLNAVVITTTTITFIFIIIISGIGNLVLPAIQSTRGGDSSVGCASD